MKVYIVDDEEIGIFIISQKLLIENIAGEKDIFAFVSAKEALNALFQCGYENLPDILLLDLSMPEMDGWQFLEAIEEMEPKWKKKCRVFILTSSIVPSDEARAKGNSFVAGFFRKPISVEDIRTLNSMGSLIA